MAFTLEHLRDASNPKGSIGGDAFGFYAGGMTPHVWTAAQIAAQTGKRALPIWVYGLGKGAGAPRANDEAAVCATVLKRLGIPKNHPVMLDMETKVDKWWVDIFTDTINLYGYWAVVYGSASTLYSNPERGGYYLATLNNDQTGAVNLLEGNKSLAGVQWRDFGPYDDSVIRDSFYHQLWQVP